MKSQNNESELSLIERHKKFITDQTYNAHKVSGCNEIVFFENRLTFSVLEAALLLGISPRTVERMIRRKELRTKKIGRRTLIPKTELGAWLNRKE